MATTVLSTSATPGGPRSFVAKTPNIVTKGDGPFTRLSTSATPGNAGTFVPKSQSDFTFTTALSTSATPGGIRTFEPKTKAYVTPTDNGPGSPSQPHRDKLVAASDRLRARLHQEDEIVIAIAAAMLSGGPAGAIRILDSTRE